ncbi:hypothetical protein P389DRAFT_211952 [Cystobasidium minutum MCA 4210]|uniref:uncharacterized protein n=1 Tax=Cystobasidium minutum MCA 4210 TaxID=1397322 RepID=UPI0034CD60A6|eukprot:jgi/Rhomi1/211952/estExt_Genemark1.C_5_t20036
MDSSPEDSLMQTLTSSQLFSSHPLPEADPFTPLLSKYLPHQARPSRRNIQAGPDDTTATLIAGRRWQALANRMADQITSRRGVRDATLEDIEAVLSDWCIRLQCLRRLQHLRLLASEAHALFTSLPPSYTIPASSVAGTPFFEPFMPFDLILLQAVIPIYLRGDHYLVLQHLQEISYGCKLEYRRTQDAIWITRLRSTAVAIVNVLYSIGELQQALDLLGSLAKHEDSPERLADLCMLALEMGDVGAADTILERLRSSKGASQSTETLQIARLLCDGQWAKAEEGARAKVQSDSTDVTAKVNLATCYLYTEKTQEGIEILEVLARTEPDRFYSSETNISNLISLQELQAGDQIANKLDLLKECSRYASESLSLDCLRL